MHGEVPRMITPLLQTALDPVTQRHRRLRALTFAAVALAGLLALALFAPRLAGFRVPLPVLLLLAYLLAWRGARRHAAGWQPDYGRIARDIEARHPDLHTMLLTAVEQQPDPQTGKLNFLQQRVIADTARLAREQSWIDAVPGWRLGGQTALVVVLLAVLTASPWFVPRPGKKKASAAARAKTDEVVTVSPGDVELERGSGFVVLATFHREVPGEAALVIARENQPPQRVPLVRNLDDPVFGGGLPEVDASFSYRIEYGGEVTRDFAVKVYEHPRLERADVALRFPDYTGLPAKTVPDTRRASAVEGSRLDVDFQLNKPVKTAKLVAKDGTAIPLAVDPAQPRATLKDFAVSASQTYELKLEDAEGRANKVPAQFVIEARPNRRPELKLATPRGDVRVSPLEEIAFRAEVWDDFGLARYGLTYTLAGGREQDIVLGTATKADERQAVEHVLKLEELGAKPDELVTWFLWAEDTGPDGQPRRTVADMYFGEVRPFEEIYRPGEGGESSQQQQAQQQGAGGQAMQQAENQKQVILATWKLKRNEDAAPQSPSEQYQKDLPVVQEAQAGVREKVEAMKEESEDPKALVQIDAALAEIDRALAELKKAESSPAPLAEALAAEQAAYNALLKLAAHEFRVTRQQQRSRGQQGQPQERQQAQLDQLEMKEDAQRYETQREAEANPQQEQQREQLATLNRLKELAQRQQDINERLKELQTALQAAKDEVEKEDIRRQLKRLREEEQRLLADLDEAQQRMEQSPQQSQLAEERRQLEQTRRDAQQAAEAMQRENATQALASGTRAQRQLDQLRDEFRRRTSGQFNDEMREMRADARELAENQKQIAERLAAEQTRPERRTLDGSGEREKLAQQFEKQQGDLTKLTSDMKRVSEQAEAAEPLLARELYDTLRQTAQADPGRTLEMTKALSQRGYGEQAQKFEEKARGEIEQLKAGVERAAERVLGDEAEALRQARGELDALSRELQGEIERNAPQLAQNAARSGSAGERAESGGEPTDEQSPAQSAPQGGQRTGQQGEENDPDTARTRGDSGEPRGAQAPRGEGGQPPASEDAQAGPGGQRREARAEAPQEGQEQGAAQAGGQPGTQAAERRDGPSGEPQSAQSGGAPRDGEQRGEGGQGEPPPDGQDNQSAGRTPQEGQRRGQAGAQAGGSRLRELTQQISRERGRRNERTGPGGGGAEEQAGPLTGEEFVQWADRLRNVEEMLDDPGLRSEVARVRELARGVRVEFKRHSVEPNWELVREKISAPLVELRNRVSEELARRESKENLVPIDRDPVPQRYTDRVRRYYEELGRSR